MINAAFADERSEEHHSTPPRDFLRHHDAREIVHHVDAQEERGRDALEHPIERRLELADELRLEQRRIERRSRDPGLDFPYVAD